MKAKLKIKVQRFTMRRVAVALAIPFYGGIVSAQRADITRISVPGSSAVTVSALNRAGNVAGHFTDPMGARHPFFWDGTSVDQGTLGGRDGLAQALNDFNQTTGYAYAIGDVDFRAFVGVGRTLFDLGTLGGSGSVGSAINNAGTVTGYSLLPGSADFHAVRCERGVMTDLGTLGGSSSAGVDINELGDVAGNSRTAFDAADRGFLQDGRFMYEIGTFGGDYSSATDLNDRGEVTGVASTEGEAEYHAFIFAPRMFTDLGTLGGTFSIGYAINESTVVAGDSSLPGERVMQGFVWSEGVMTSVGHLGSGSSGVWGLNNSNQVVGVSTNAQGLPRAFLWQNGTILDLNSTLRSGSDWVLEAAYHINDAGQIVGTGFWQGQPAWYRLELNADANQPPVAHAGDDRQSACGSAVVLDGRGSSDPDGDALLFSWFEGERPLGNDAQLTADLPPGVHVLRLRVTDPQGAFADDEVTVSIADIEAPRIVSVTAEAGPVRPHQQWVSIHFSVAAADSCDSQPVSRIVRVESHGPNCHRNQRDERPDWRITGDLSLDVRSEPGRHGSGVYTVVLVTTDQAGNSSSRTIRIAVERKASRVKIVVRDLK